MIPFNNYNDNKQLQIEKKKCFKPQLTGRQTRIELEAMRRNPVSSRVTSLTREHRITNPVS